MAFWNRKKKAPLRTRPGVTQATTVQRDPYTDLNNPLNPLSPLNPLNQAYQDGDVVRETEVVRETHETPANDEPQRNAIDTSQDPVPQDSYRAPDPTPAPSYDPPPSTSYDPPSSSSYDSGSSYGGSSSYDSGGGGFSSSDSGGGSF